MLQEEAEAVGSGCVRLGMRGVQGGEGVCTAHPEMGVPDISNVKEGEGEWASCHKASPSPKRAFWTAVVCVVGAAMGRSGNRGESLGEPGIGQRETRRVHRLDRLNFFLWDLCMGWWVENTKLERRPPPSTIFFKFQCVVWSPSDIEGP